MTHAEMAALLGMDDNYRVLRRLAPAPAYCTPTDGVEKRIAALVDVETTGLDPAHDKIIELGMLLFEYGPDGQIYEALSPHSQWFEDPGVPISAEITKINGITDSMVASCRIDDAEIDRLLPSVSVVISHNAAFDRPFLEKRVPGFERKAWGCSMSAIDWRAEGCTSRSLEFIAFKSGVFYDGHRAIVDCQALLHVLAQPLPVSGRRALAALLDAERVPTWRIWARGAPFEAKDILKARGCTWSSGENGRPKSWFRDVPDPAYLDEAAWMRANAGVREVWGLPFTASKRYSDRCWDWGKRL
jgi:DNA polymerase-3 subunit epsilon